jgi:hypothetical protein
MLIAVIVREAHSQSSMAISMRTAGLACAAALALGFYMAFQRSGPSEFQPQTKVPQLEELLKTHKTALGADYEGYK